MRILSEIWIHPHCYIINSHLQNAYDDPSDIHCFIFFVLLRSNVAFSQHIYFLIFRYVELVTLRFLHDDFAKNNTQL